jgi:hypothetical protein
VIARALATSEHLIAVSQNPIRLDLDAGMGKKYFKNDGNSANSPNQSLFSFLASL